MTEIINPVVHKEVKARKDRIGFAVGIPGYILKNCGINWQPDRVEICSDREHAPGCIILRPVTLVSETKA